MASPAAVGAGVVGGTAAVGATSVAAYQAFNKGGTSEETPTLKEAPNSQPGQTQNEQQTDTQLQERTNDAGSAIPDATGKGATDGNTEELPVSPKTPVQNDAEVTDPGTAGTKGNSQEETIPAVTTPAPKPTSNPLPAAS
ncbi:hypothetical protein [Candidatus Mycoplasma haematohominis]|uniref:hypothetical protein n=1 Tax=Candidatus Mycoplasma haematohominis TaxID=1494318 RepID=UPI001C0A6DD8|nr:hypothetical protein [Candidatus Mycoplasma haemohominis]